VEPVLEDRPAGNESLAFRRFVLPTAQRDSAFVSDDQIDRDDRDVLDVMARTNAYTGVSRSSERTLPGRSKSSCNRAESASSVMLIRPVSTAVPGA
jgi:hypothetical protein